MARRDSTRLLTPVLALAFLFHAAVRPLAMSASLAGSAATRHMAMAGMDQRAAATPNAETHREHQPSHHRHCGDECCGVCVTAFTMSVASVTIPLPGPLVSPVVVRRSPSAPRGPPRYRQPLPIGPPASRA
jgi:hypothetical protein